ncbi:MAG: M14 family metallopeptidase [Bacteroidales bacterium]|nr:M14 family metallopeptidase [Bacteroidales bacterium]
MNKLILFLLFFCFFSNLSAQDSEWLTYYEKSGFKKTPRYKETIDYCKKLEKNSPWVHFTNFGKSPQGRDLPLLIIDRNSNFSPKAVHSSGNVILLIQAGIHPGEIEGKDAGLMFIRDIVINKKYSYLLEHITILFIPIFNVDGHERFGPNNRINQNGPEEMGWRVTAQNLNLNRDYLKADTPEMQFWIKFFNKWLPDFFIDCHTTDGADYQYVLTYALEIYGNMDPDLTKWQKEVYLKYIELKMDESGSPIFPYISFRQWHNPKSGIISGVSPPMISQGYTALQNRLGLLIETHMLKPYKPRVDATYKMLKYSAELLNMEYQNLKELVKKADKFVESKDFRVNEFTVKYENNYNDSIIVEFLGIEYDAVESDLTDGTWFQYKDNPKTFQLAMFNNPQASVKVKLPEAYIIPPEWTRVIERLELHGINYSKLKKAQIIKVKSYKFRNYNWRTTPYEGRQIITQLDYDEIEEEREFPSGSVIVDMNQRTARIIAHILEPKASDSFISWGFFNSIFEQKEYGENYVMEKVAREMLAKDPELKKEFEQKKINDPDFANSQWHQLNWFYQKTPYWDEKKDVYPVGKIYEKKVLDSVLKNF